jgi:RNA polymerase sigma-70 factor (ECF subfamily)
MSADQTTAAVRRYLDELAGDAPVEPIIRAVLEKSAQRLQILCASLLRRSYPPWTRPPLNLAAEELFGGVVERLLNAMRSLRPQTVRQFFALANQHMRWELNDLARRLDEKRCDAPPSEGMAPAPESSGSGPENQRVRESWFC